MDKARVKSLIALGINPLATFVWPLRFQASAKLALSVKAVVNSVMARSSCRCIACILPSPIKALGRSDLYDNSNLNTVVATSYAPVFTLMYPTHIKSSTNSSPHRCGRFALIAARKTGCTEWFVEPMFLR